MGHVLPSTPVRTSIMRKFSLLAALAGAVLASDLAQAQNWNQRNPLQTPSPRRTGALQFDVVATGSRVLMHGGLEQHPGGILDETWTYNGSTWTQLNVSAPARWGHQIVKDEVNNRLITFGGRSPSISALANDTWAWNGSTWIQLTPVISPPARFRYGMAYDNRRHRVVVFGGRAQNNLDDTWEFNGLNWAENTTTTARPQPREDMAFAFDASTGSVVLFGGYDNDTATLLGDTWEYRGDSWQEVAPATSPTPRYRASAAYDSIRQRVVVYGGYDGIAFRTQTYEYTGSDWSLIATPPGSSQSTEMYCAYDPARDLMVTFGGVGSLFSNETWEYDGASTAFFGSFGSGCPHSLGRLSTVTGTPPIIGQQFDMQITEVPLTSGAVFVVQGFSSSTWSGGALPFDLTPFGLIGCALEVADDAVMVVLANASGGFEFGFPIPNDTTLINLPYYVQAYVPDILSPNGFGGVSRPSRGIFGN